MTTTKAEREKILENLRDLRLRLSDPEKELSQENITRLIRLVDVHSERIAQDIGTDEWQKTIGAEVYARRMEQHKKAKAAFPLGSKVVFAIPGTDVRCVGYVFCHDDDHGWLTVGLTDKVVGEFGDVRVISYDEVGTETCLIARSAVDAPKNTTCYWCGAEGAAESHEERWKRLRETALAARR